MKTKKPYILIAVALTVLSAGCDKDSGGGGTTTPSYAVTVTSDGDCVAVADKETAEAGETVTLTAAVETGFEFLQWEVIIGTVTLKDAEALQTTFTMPAEDVSIRALFSSLGGSFGIETVKIPAGTFRMGSPGSEPNRDAVEISHTVTLTKDFWMSKYEISNQQYAAFLNANELGTPARMVVDDYGEQLLVNANQWGVVHDGRKWAPASGYENHPVIHVTWCGAKAYAIWVGGFLPTEAQWEYAARGGQAESQPFGLGDGTKLTHDMANFSVYYPYDIAKGGQYEDESGTGYTGCTEAVGKYKPNDYGLYDMHGNVSEWCSDRYGTYPASQATDPTGPGIGTEHILRGGSWASYAQHCRSARRGKGLLNYVRNDAGFRVVFVP